MSVVLTETADRIFTITINRPDKLNALNPEVMDALAAAFEKARQDDAVGGVILTGAGEKAFVAGADIRVFTTLTPAGARAFAKKGQALFDRIENLGKPVVAAVNGFALGGGCELAMACTLRVASKTAKLGQPEVNLGVMPGYGGSQRLPRLVGKGRAFEILLTGDPITAEEAFRIGLVNRVVEPGELLATSRAILAKILSRAPMAVGCVLDAVNRGLDMPFGAAEDYEATLFGLCVSTEDMKEGVAAFLEKRPAKFAGK
ncbi:MAG: enoyl-CoA hydratase-related protein, partial [Acidobacteriota bacterium]|nr:enoyl-CoA hydratase-related protein [Acidobacteriota bacterium]